MGCFNVACSISRISINHGDPVVFVPLLRRSYLNNVDNSRGLPFLIYSNAVYSVLGFPIKGIYDHYGSIESIEKNANTKALEKFFKCNVEDLTYPENIKYNLNKFSNILSDYSVDFGGEFLSKIGFVGCDNSFYFLEKVVGEKDFLVVLKSDDKQMSSYDIIETTDSKSIVYEGEFSYSCAKKRFVEHFYKVTGIKLGVNPEDYEVDEMVNHISGMFFHRSVYEAMMEDLVAKTPKRTLVNYRMNEDIFKEIGFVEEVGKEFVHPQLSGVKLGLDRYSVELIVGDKRETLYGLNGALGLKQLLKKKFDFDLNISSLYSKSVAGYEFDCFRKSLEAIEKSAMIAKKYPQLGDFDMFSLVFNPFSEDGGFQCQHQPFFDKIYKGVILDGSIRQDWEEWQSFVPCAFSANIHWSPAMNGEQDGNDEESIKMLEAALRVLKARKN